MVAEAIHLLLFPFQLQKRCNPTNKDNSIFDQGNIIVIVITIIFLLSVVNSHYCF